MIYRVVVHIGYYERWFDFETIESAGHFAKDILEHQVSNDDHKEKETSVTIRLVDILAEKRQEENK